MDTGSGQFTVTIDNKLHNYMLNRITLEKLIEVAKQYFALFEKRDVYRAFKDRASLVPPS